MSRQHRACALGEGRARSNYGRAVDGEIRDAPEPEPEATRSEDDAIFIEPRWPIALGSTTL